VATVVKYRLPKNGNDGVEKQKKDYLENTRIFIKMNFNAAIVQVRTAGERFFYDSDYAPFGLANLTGEEGNCLQKQRKILLPG